jgi:transposase-like protein
MFPNVPSCSASFPAHSAARERTNPARADAALSTRQLAGLRLLLAGRGVSDVARELGVTRQTVGRWRRDPAFASEFRRRHEQLVDRLADSL